MSTTVHVPSVSKTDQQLLMLDSSFFYHDLNPVFELVGLGPRVVNFDCPRVGMIVGGDIVTAQINSCIEGLPRQPGPLARAENPKKNRASPWSNA